MKALTSNVTKALPIGARLQCIDNTGAREVEIIAVKGYKGVKMCIRDRIRYSTTKTRCSWN